MNTISGINNFMKQNQKKLLLSSFIVSRFSYCLLIWMFCSKTFAKEINTIHKRSLQIILNDYKSSNLFALEEGHQITFHQRHINTLMIKVCKYLTEYLLDVKNDILTFREKCFQSPRLSYFQLENTHSLKFGIQSIPYRRFNQFWQLPPTDIHETCSLEFRTGNLQFFRIDFTSIFKVLDLYIYII